MMTTARATSTCRTMSTFCPPAAEPNGVRPVGDGACSVPPKARMSRKITTVAAIMRVYASATRTTEDSVRAPPGAASSARSDVRGVAHGESRVAAGGDFVARLPVGADPANVGHEDARLAGDVRAHVPGVGPRIERGVAHLVDVRDPGFLGLDGGLDHRAAVRAQEGDALGDPVHVLLDRHDHVAEHRGAAGSGDREEVREPGDGDPQV